jgi:hypothetical protein
MAGHAWTHGNRAIGYNPRRRRLWVGGQRLHHGATGIALAGMTLARLAARRQSVHRGLPWMLAGSAMVVHDWKDRAVWFQRGMQE